MSIIKNKATERTINKNHIMTRQDTYNMSNDTLCAEAYKLAHEDSNNPNLALLVDELIVRVRVYIPKSNEASTC